MRTAEAIQAEIIQHLGFFPPFFAPALSAPAVLESLWQQMLSAYVNNPIPALFKEKLAALLGRYCSVPYCLVCHSSALRPLGMSAAQVLELLEQPAPGFQELTEKVRCLEVAPAPEWPEAGSACEECVLYCCVSIFLNQDPERCHETLKHLLGGSYYAFVVLYLAYNRTALSWAEAHPELSHAADQRVREHLGPLLEEAPALRDFFENYPRRVQQQRDRRMSWLTHENQRFLEEQRESRLRIEAERNEKAALLDAAEEGIYGLDIHGRCTFINQAAARMLGYSTAEVIGQDMHALVHHRHWDGTPYPEEACPILHVMKTGQPFKGDEDPLWRKDGSKFLSSCSSSPILDEGSVTGAVVTFHDITQERANREALLQAERTQVAERARYESTFLQAPVAICVLSGPEHVFTLANAHYLKLLGGTRDLLGKPVRQALPELEGQGFYEVLDQVFESGETFFANELPVELRLEDGQMKRIYCNFINHPARGPQGEVRDILVVANDVTEQVLARKRIEETVRELVEERELRERFVEALSHDLRTPLTAARMSAQLVIRSQSDPLKLQRAAGRIVDNLDRADGMIRDLLDASRLKAGERLPLDVGPCELGEVARETLEDLASVHGERFVLKAPGPLHGHWDRQALRRIIENLAGNAIKYGAKGAPVTVRLDPRGDAVALAVHNVGEPIAPEDLERLFTPFRRAESANRGAEKGWGIGLALVRGLAQAHGGSAQVHSAAGAGTTFVVRLPLDARPPAPAAEAP